MKRLSTSIEIRLLFDENLPRSLPKKISDLFPNATHVADSDLTASPDSEIWEYAKASGYTIVTKDKDFVAAALKDGPPPSVIHLDIGNCPVWQLVEVIRDNVAAIQKCVVSGHALLTVKWAAKTKPND